MKVNVQRTHDKEIYLKEDRYEKPKEIFKVMADLVRHDQVITTDCLVCDFGCAAGEFLYYLVRQFPEAQYTGFDVVPELIEKAREKLPDVRFQSGSVLDRSILPESSVDVAFLLGVLSIFDEFEPCISNMLYWVRPGGRIYVKGIFNKYPADVWVKYRLADDPDPSHREPGWNMFSKASIARFLDDTIGKDKHAFIPFEMPFDLEPNPDDPVRSWTFSDSHHRRLFTNGLSLLCNQEILEIRP